MQWSPPLFHDTLSFATGEVTPTEGDANIWENVRGKQLVPARSATFLSSTAELGTTGSVDGGRLEEATSSSPHQQHYALRSAGPSQDTNIPCWEWDWTVVGLRRRTPKPDIGNLVSSSGLHHLKSLHCNH